MQLYSQILCVIVAAKILIAIPTCAAQDSPSYDEIAYANYSRTTTPKPAGYFDTQGDQETEQAQPLPPKKAPYNFDIYRDCDPYPVDPRKPCHICVQRQGTDPKFKERHDRIYGFQGRPYRELEPGGCLCAKKKQKFKFTNLNVYWPSALSAVYEDKFPGKAAAKAANYGRFHLLDGFDWLGGFEVSKYQRRDNGFCGPGYERYGCLGESKTIEAGLLHHGNGCGCDNSGDCRCTKQGCVCSGRNSCGVCNPQFE